MNPSEIIVRAQTEGVILSLTSRGGIRAIGETVAVNRWLPIIRDNKTALVSTLKVTSAEQWREFESLLAIVGPAFNTPAHEYAEIREVAAGDPINALECFRTLAERDGITNH
jgi:hypothetical protein